ncbi:MAG: protein kinase [Acidobacteriota bacterium]
MMEKDAASELAQQIADCEAPDWGADPGADRVDAMRLIHEVAAGFRAAAAPEAQPPSLFAWRHLDVREEIGRGAFGRVYRAWDSLLKRDVALKLSEPASRRTLEPGVVIAEARCLARVRHPNILAVHGADSVDGQVGIWSDLLVGRTLEQLLDERPRLPAEAVIDVGLPLADAVALIHRRALVHGDIKPANIMIRDDATPVLMDFGAAREQGRSAAAAFGSPRFMAPEQLDGAGPAPEGDLFALGVVLCRCLTGRYPWPATTRDELEAAFRQGDRPDLGGVPRGFRPLVNALLSADPTRRPAAREVADRLAHLRDAPRRRRRRAAVAAVMASLALALALTVTALRSEKRTRLEVQALRDLTISALQEADPERTSGPTSIKVVYDALAEGMDGALAEYPAALADMRLIVARGQQRLGEEEAALEIFQRVLDETPVGVKQLARRRCVAMLGLADVAAEIPDVARAEAAVEAALDPAGECPRALPPAQKLTARNLLGKVLNRQGKWQEMLEVQVTLLADREQLHGVGGEATAVDHHNVARAYMQVGRLDEALHHGVRAQEILQGVDGEESLRLGYIKLLLAEVHNDRGAFDLAQENLDMARDLYASNLPPDHPALLGLDGEQGRLWRRSGALGRAEALFRDRLQKADAEAPAVRRHALRDLSYILLATGRWSEAGRLLAELRSILPERLSPLTTYFAAAEIYADARQGQAEVEHARRAIDVARADLAGQSLNRIEPYEQLESWDLALAEGPSSGE